MAKKVVNSMNMKDVEELAAVLMRPE